MEDPTKNKGFVFHYGGGGWRTTIACVMFGDRV